VIGSGLGAQTYGGEAAGTLAPWGVDVVAGGSGPTTLPLSLTVGAWLLDRADVAVAERSYRSLTDTAADAGEADAVEAALAQGTGPDVVLLVMGDGSSTRTAKSPGGLNPGAEAYDATVCAALSTGDAVALAAAAAEPASRAVGAAGGAAWRAAASLLGGPPLAAARLIAFEAPYGVAYPVAVWTRPLNANSSADTS